MTMPNVLAQPVAALLPPHMVAGRTTDDSRALLARVAAAVDSGIAAGPAPTPRRRWSPA